MKVSADLPENWQNWLPPDPHREKICAFLAAGRCSLLSQGPDKPPLIMYEDGGMMELDKVRWDDTLKFHHADPAGRRSGEGPRATRFSDVCGTVDEMKQLFAGQPQQVAAHPEIIHALLTEALGMIDRLDERHAQYRQAEQKLKQLIEELLAVPRPEVPPAQEGAQRIREIIAADAENISARLDELNRLSEQVRAVAQAQEDRLRDRKNAILALGAIYRKLRGKRNWSEDEARADAELEI